MQLKWNELLIYLTHQYITQYCWICFSTDCAYIESRTAEVNPRYLVYKVEVFYLNIGKLNFGKLSKMNLFVISYAFYVAWNPMMLGL